MDCINECHQVIRHESEKPCKIDVHFTLELTMFRTIGCICLSAFVCLLWLVVGGAGASAPGWARKAIIWVPLIQAAFAIAAIAFEVRHRHKWAVTFALLGAPTAIVITVNLPWFWH